MATTHDTPGSQDSLAGFAGCRPLFFNVLFTDMKVTQMYLSSLNFLAVRSLSVGRKLCVYLKNYMACTDRSKIISALLTTV